MNRKSVPIVLSVLLGACVCVLCAVLLLSGGYLASMTPDSPPPAATSSSSPSKLLPDGLTPSSDPPPTLQFSLQAGELASADLPSVGQTEQALIDWARQESGAHTRLGSQADEFFRQVDTARTLAVQKMVQQLQTGSKPIGRPAPLPPPPVNPAKAAQLTSIVGALTFLSGAPLIFADARRDEQGNAIPPPLEMDSTTEDNVHVHMKIQPKLMGSQLEANVEMTVNAQKDGMTYAEKATGMLRTNLCPNAQGEVPLELTLSGGVAVEGGGVQWQFKSQATGHVDDEANLTDYDVKTQGDMAAQPGDTGKARGEESKYIDLNIGFAVDKFNEKNPAFTRKDASATRWSSKTDMKFAYGAVEIIHRLSSLAVTLSYAMAQIQWQGGYCVAIAVPELESGATKVVPVDSETPFTALVRHKFEGKDLNNPVVATLASGKTSITPSGSKVSPPAKYRYKAPNECAETATVQLESRSKRGIGTLRSCKRITCDFH